MAPFPERIRSSTSFMTKQFQKRTKEFLKEAEGEEPRPRKRQKEDELGYSEILKEIHDSDPNMGVLKDMNDYIRRGRRNVLVVGPPGVGKTTLVSRFFRANGKKVKSIHLPSADEFIDLVGIPELVKHRHLDPSTKKEIESQTLQFIRKADLDEVDAVYLDEINRVSDPGKLNFVMDFIQSSVLGTTRLKNIKYVWAGMNPQTADAAREVREMDSAIFSRLRPPLELFPHPLPGHYNFPLPENPEDLEEMEMTGRSPVSERAATIVSVWWHRYIKPQEGWHEIMNPRDLHDLAQEIDWIFADREEGTSSPEDEARKLAHHTEAHKRVDKSSPHANITLPLGPLMNMINKQKEYSFAELRNDSKKLPEVLRGIEENPEEALRIADLFYAELKKRDDLKTVKLEDLGNFSKVLTTLPREHISKLFQLNMAVVHYFHDKNEEGTLTPEEETIYKNFEGEIEGAWEADDEGSKV